MSMQTHENAIPVSTAAGIDVAGIEKQLASMWAKGHQPDTDAGVVRACTQNLVVCTTPREDRSRVDEMLDQTAQSHPGRTLILVVDREAGDSSIEAYVSTRCQALGSNSKQICGEQVTMNASGSHIQTAASAISPLLVPDVPVFLFWDDIPCYEDHFFNQMVGMADRIVIDSAAFKCPYKDILLLDGLIKERAQFTHFSDLNWGRLTSWRTLVASFWDVPDYRQYLDDINRLSIEYSPASADPASISASALLVVGWLASRLGWKPQPTVKHLQDNATIFVFKSGSRDMEVEVRSTSLEADHNGSVMKLAFKAVDGAAEFNVGLSADRTRLETGATIGSEPAITRVVEYRKRSEGERLCRELSILRSDVVYEAAIGIASQLSALLKNR